MVMEMRYGNLWKSIILYSLPLMFTNVLQVLFNMADVAVVGKFAGPISLGAVGSTTILITLTTGLLIGMANGINAIAALFIGANEDTNLKNTVNTGFILSLLVGFTVAVFGIIFSKNVLLLLGTKDELITEALIYLRIYLLGSPALSLFNFGNGILSAAGDTKKPLKYLLTAGVINIILNLFFVIVLNMRSSGVGLASIISQYISAILIFLALTKSKEKYRLSFSNLCFDKKIAIKILSISVPSALQYTLFALANLYIQSAVNTFDHITVEGNAAAANADGLVYDLIAAFYTACTSFIAQNFGAGNSKRIKQTYFITTIYSAGIAIFLGLALFTFKNSFLLLFTDDYAVINIAAKRLEVMALSYWISVFMDNATAALRGLSKTLIPTIILVLGTVVFRVIWVLTIFTHFHTLQGLFLLYPTAWILTAIIENIYLIYVFRKTVH